MTFGLAAIRNNTNSTRQTAVRDSIIGFFFLVFIITVFGIEYGFFKSEEWYSVPQASQYSAELGDFGFSCLTAEDEILRTFCRLPYAAELFKDNSYSGKPVNVWAFGVFLFYMLVGVTPFQGEFEKMKTMIKNAKFDKPLFSIGARLKNRFEIVGEFAIMPKVQYYEVKDIENNNSLYLMKVQEFDVSDDEIQNEMMFLMRCKRRTGFPQLIDVFPWEFDYNCMVMTKEGDTLHSYFRQWGFQMSMENTVQLGFRLFKVLEAMHRLNFVHRDVSMRNVTIVHDFFQGTASIKLIDFGRTVEVNPPQQCFDWIALHHSLNVIEDGFYTPIDDFISATILIMLSQRINPFGKEKSDFVRRKNIFHRNPMACFEDPSTHWIGHLYEELELQRLTGLDMSKIYAIFHDAIPNFDPKTPITTIDAIGDNNVGFDSSFEDRSFTTNMMFEEKGVFADGSIINKRFQVERKTFDNIGKKIFVVRDMSQAFATRVLKTRDIYNDDPFDEIEFLHVCKDLSGFPTLIDEFVIDDTYNCFVMTNEGDTLMSQLKYNGKHRKFTMENSIRLCHRLFELLEQVHSLGFIHRDVHFSSVMVDKEWDGTMIVNLIGFDKTVKVNYPQKTIDWNNWSVSLNVSKNGNYTTIDDFVSVVFVAMMTQKVNPFGWIKKDYVHLKEIFHRNPMEFFDPTTAWMGKLYLALDPMRSTGYNKFSIRKILEGAIPGFDLNTPFTTHFVDEVLYID